MNVKQQLFIIIFLNYLFVYILMVLMVAVVVVVGLFLL